VLVQHLITSLDELSGAQIEQMWIDETDRRYREGNRNMLVMVGNAFAVTIPENFCLVSLRQLKDFIRYNNFVNVQCRCLLGAVFGGGYC